MPTVHCGKGSSWQRERAEVHVLRVIPNAGLGAHHALTGYSLTAETGVRDGTFECLRALVQTELDAFISRAAPLSPVRVPEQVVSHVRLDSPALGIVELASAIAADLIVLGRHGQRGSSHCSWARWPKYRAPTRHARYW